MSLDVRLYATAVTPGQDNHIDLGIYRNSGQLVVNHINPYDSSDGYEIRQKLRTNNDAYNSWVSETQERWNHYAGSNLPLTVLILGGIEDLWIVAGFDGSGYASATFYRYCFAVFDSILCVVIAMYILRFWEKRSLLFKLAAILFTAVLNPILLYQGSILPEEKGLQVAFMLLALYFARSEGKVARLILAGVFTGASIAYKGIGVFIVPLVFWYAVLNGGEGGSGGIWSRTRCRDAITFAASVLSVLMLTCLPFLAGLTQMMSGRLSGNMDTKCVIHASIWRVFVDLLPHHWGYLRSATIVVYLVAAGVILRCRRSHVEDAFAAVVLLFTNVMLLAGSLDRMNMGILFCLVVLCHKDHYREMYYYFIIAGFLILSCHLPIGFNGQPRLFPLLPSYLFPDEEYRNALFALGFTALHLLGLYRVCAEKGAEGARTPLHEPATPVA
ncbi:hypothetical protein LPW11_17840 [Geomonas sp. RF6]|uniref:hypothetical protein n=1 Tax=Geomonas sp. RF6 TaxID=2897342 RepID=UPI001E4EF3FE|nr:hypothetical protein [Geomonas sp. RF6]UFS69744.1 hypothetical protein LPW11_17840 [Geomonas sp. RF6]